MSILGDFLGWWNWKDHEKDLVDGMGYQKLRSLAEDDLGEEDVLLLSEDDLVAWYNDIERLKGMSEQDHNTIEGHRERPTFGG